MNSLNILQNSILNAIKDVYTQQINKINNSKRRQLSPTAHLVLKRWLYEHQQNPYPSGIYVSVCIHICMYAHVYMYVCMYMHV